MLGMFSANLLKRNHAVALNEVFRDLDDLARQTGFIQRHSNKCSAQGFLLTLLKSVSTGKCSFSQLSQTLGFSQRCTMSRQAMHRRLNERSTAFLRAVLHQVLAHKITATTAGSTSAFTRIILEDSTQFRMHPSNRVHYRGMTNQNGIGSSVKVDLAYDVLSKELVQLQDAPSHVQDKTLGPPLIARLKKGDLVLRDMGYFSVESFEQIERSQAFYISRLHGQANVTLENGQSLEQLLAHTSENVLDLPCLVTNNKKPARLIAIRASEEVAAKRRRQQRTKRKSNGTQPNRCVLIREGWMLYITNIESTQHNALEIDKLYRLRWEVEISFRAIKAAVSSVESFNRITNPYHLESMLIAIMIITALTFKIASKLTRQSTPRLSIEKLTQWVVHTLEQSNQLPTHWQYDKRQIQYDKRRRNSMQDNRNLLLS